MIIINVNKPLQDEFTRDEEVELIDGVKKFWFTCTTLFPEGNLELALEDLEKRVAKKGAGGIYYYGTGEFTRTKQNSKEEERVFYVRWDYYYK